MVDLLQNLLDRSEISPDSVVEAAAMLAEGQFEPAVAGGLLVALQQASDEVFAKVLVGFAQAFRERMVFVEGVPPGAIDTCGTGGGPATWNISTAAAIVAAGAGVPVAKHGNRAVTSKVGSADVLEALGISLDADPRRCWDQANIAFFFAPNHHPAFRHVGPLRRALPIRTIFNSLGPLLNPAGVLNQVIGVTVRQAAMAEANALLGSVRSLIVTGDDGMDELSPAAGSQVVEITSDGCRQFHVDLAELGMVPVPPDALLPGHDATENAHKMVRALQELDSLECQCLLPTAGAALWVGGKVESIAEGVMEARSIIRTGQAWATLQKWREAAQAS